MILEQPARELREILRRAALGRIGQPVGVGEVGGGAAPGPGAFAFMRTTNASSVPPMCSADGRRGVIGRGDGHALEQGAERYRLTGLEPHAIARRLRGALADHDGLVPLRLAGLDRLARQIQRHQLDQARGRVILGRILREEHLAVGVEEEHRLGAEDGTPPVLGRRRVRDEDEHRSEEENSRRALPLILSAAGRCA